MSEITLEKINEAVVALRAKQAEIDGGAKNVGELTSQISKLNNFLDKQEEKSQEILLEEKRQSQHLEEMLKKHEQLIVESRRLGSAGDLVNAELKTFDAVLRMQEKGIRSDVNPLGGFAVAEAFSNQVVIKQLEISPIRSICSVFQLPAKAESFPLVNGVVGGGFYEEGVPIPVDSQMKLGSARVNTKRQGVIATATNSEIQDAGFDLISEIQRQVAERFAKDEGASAINGDGITGMSGILNDSRIGFIKSGSNTGLTFDALIDATGEIESFYEPIYAFNRKTLAKIRKLKDEAGHYIWQAGNLGAGIPNQINGFKYVILPDMPDVATGTFPILFGDFRQYKIGDRRSLNVIIDDKTLADSDQIRYVFSKRVGGALMQPAFVKIKIEQ
jgi:HK97 family phage major capsid protein